jgi:hypothetical protein
MRPLSNEGASGVNLLNVRLVIVPAIKPKQICENFNLIRILLVVHFSCFHFPRYMVTKLDTALPSALCCEFHMTKFLAKKYVDR